MSYRVPVRVAGRRSRSVLAALMVVSVAVLGRQSLAGTATTATAPTALEPRPHDLPHLDQHGAAGEADGVVADGVTVFEDSQPAVANLDPDLLHALRRAATDAAGARVRFYVDSGWRSPRYQEQLLEDAIEKYGSREEAARWVASPDSSAHVSGDAVDIGHADATAWLSKHGAAYGLCQIYANEPWHFELRPKAIGGRCPPMYADASQDPRMQH